MRIKRGVPVGGGIMEFPAKPIGRGSRVGFGRDGLVTAGIEIGR